MWGIGWTDNNGTETTIEGYSVVESKSSLEGEGKEEFKVRNDWETYGQCMQSSCVGIDFKRRRRMMAKLRGGTAELGIEIGRWHGLR